jgi:serine protease Do
MRRFLLFLIVVILVVYGANWLNKSRRTNGAGRAPKPEQFTPAEGLKIDPSEMKVLAALDQEYTRLVEAVVPSVVSLHTSRTLRGNAALDPFAQFFGLPRGLRGRLPREQVQTSLGSGVIVSKEGHVLTNNHVVAEMEEIKAQLSDGRTIAARVIGTDEFTDLAVLKLDAKDLTPLPLGDSDEVKVGQVVFAIGNPFGLDETVTQGIISAKGRRAMHDSGNEFFQTDTAINPGNSGGPLVDLRGQIIGINSAIFSPNGAGMGGTPTWAGVGFAIPSNVATRVLNSIIKTGRVQRGYLGVVVQPLNDVLAEQFGAKDARGALVSEVAQDSPAEKAGIQTGDIIEEFNGHKIKDAQDLVNRVAEVDLTQKVNIKVWRERKELEVTAEIAEAPADLKTRTGRRAPIQPGAQGSDLLDGVTVQEIPQSARLDLPSNISGVMVKGIEPDSPAADTLAPGDVIEEINQQPVGSIAEWQRVTSNLTDDRAVLLVCRGRTRTFVVITR